MRELTRSRIAVVAALAALPVSVARGVCAPGYSGGDWYDATRGDAAAYDVVVDREDNVIAAGFQTVDETSAYMGRKAAWMVRKYRPDGGTLWTRTVFGGKAWGGAAKALALDREGNIIVVGYEVHADIAQGNNWLTMKFDRDGKELWERKYNAAGDGDDWAAAVAVDSSGAIVVAGAEDRTDSGRGHDWRIHKYSPDGGALWNDSYNSDAPDSLDQATAVAIGREGSIYVAGIQDRGQAGESDNWLIRCYSPEGKVRWSRAHNSDRNGRDIPYAADVDVYGNLVVAGVTDADDNKRRSIHVRKYRPTGELIGSFSHRSRGSMGDEARDVLFTPDGDVIVVGSEDRDFGRERDLAVRSFSFAGSQKWVLYHDAGNDNRSQAEGVAMNSKGDLMVAGWDAEKGWKGMNWVVIRYRPAPCPETSLSIEVTRQANLRHVQLNLAVKNAGPITISEIKPEFKLTAGDAILADAQGPNPAGPLTLDAGQSGEFHWTYGVTGSGKVAAEVTVKGKENRDWKEVSSTAKAELVLD